MKIIDIIAEAEIPKKWWEKIPGINILLKPAEKKALERIIKEIEKKYARDKPRLAALERLSDEYVEYRVKLANDYGPGMSPASIQTLFKKKYPSDPLGRDAEFLADLERYGQAKFNLKIADEVAAAKASREGEASTSTSPGTPEAARETDEIVKKTKELWTVVNDRGTVINTVYGTVIAAEYINIWLRYQGDVNTTEDNVRKGKIPTGDLPFWPPCNGNTPISTDLSKGIGLRKNSISKPYAPYTYDNEASRLYSYRDWRNTESFNNLLHEFTMATAAFALGEATIGKFGAGKLVNKAIGLVAKIAPESKFNRIGQLLDATAISAFVYNMSTDQASEAFKAAYLDYIFAPMKDKFIESIGESLMPYETFIKIFSEIGASVLKILGKGVPTNPVDVTPTPVPVDKTEKKQSDPIATTSGGDNVEKKNPPEQKEKKSNEPAIDNSPAGRARSITDAKSSGAATVTIAGKQFNTNDFVDAGDSWDLKVSPYYSFPK